tara:strand:- start:391 stop:573 length:183 start_codon:yes stop_codon:yes gene_type:complete
MKLKLTSVKIDSDLRKDFKILSIQDGMTLQKLINRTIFLYKEDKKFRKKILEIDNLGKNI